MRRDVNRGVVIFHHNQGIVYESENPWLELYKPIEAPLGIDHGAVPVDQPMDTQMDTLHFLGPYHYDPCYGLLGVWVPKELVSHVLPYMNSGYFPNMFGQDNVSDNTLEYEEQEFFLKFHMPR